ncbi:magnesium chelatase [candidate division CPR3 bacterium GWF2_35_18]|uniref:Mg chelatase, subunit ChlI n=1 Tax=candidate division CPR3 bacterium GW2011_GWF2_35_18 TaxID=1618350 RepID=A0A0G0C0J5_UNCC3|nr:MAG: Mg chelatase, subunit ChlI [candidate division CPR3 bacterium GW2011_GWF2_35_18]KKP87066.1 MAG: Mg chelatase, subunit ChlI [candidate division CPR3 bacterium GW2011_GWE2_35_7]OGB63115.1 MAG: magnesium chelatase [candidate division CPR3 bacterium GWF2_35_18]OGB64071.1 MAG: magnesium chelatase [candidate division CPR3 bacterium RIFOXYA2_FULL_35_13]OGB80609.1 MAG: magnesium chelatase [candidate division CPR3 bacterium GWE2_35_7]
MLSKISSGATFGLESISVDVEVDVSRGNLPKFNIVGLPDKAVEESKERVRSAIKNSGAKMPVSRITVNLAPADLPKEGPAYDLPIAVGLLIASEQLKGDFSDSFFLGELSLDGSLRHTNGVLPQVQLAKNHGFKKVFVPAVNGPEAAIIPGIEIVPVNCLLDLYYHLLGDKLIPSYQQGNLENLFSNDVMSDYDLSRIRGQEQAKRAIEIAAAGGHNIFFSGPPGAGKTLLARTIPTILPRLTLEEALEVTKVYSVSGLLSQKQAIVKIRPFRAPHHTTSHVGLVGGGVNPKPGEISLAHRGVLFLDEFPEFPRQVLEAMRQPLEDGIIQVSRAKGTVAFPAKFMLIAASNPCPCGFLGDETRECTCLPTAISRYQKKISGPILDRIDLILEVPAVKVEKLTNTEEGIKVEDSKTVAKRVQNARDKQVKRFSDSGIFSNAEMRIKEIEKFCQLSNDVLNLMRQAVSQLRLSARSYYRTLKVARTITDLSESEEIQLSHVAEALQYRPKIEF